MKARTSRSRFDELRRFNYVGEEMGRARLDSDANEQALITRTDMRRRTGDLAEGSPDDGFLLSEDHILAPVGRLSDWQIDGLPPDDAREIRRELGFARRDPESLPHVVRARGATALRQRFARPLNLLARPIPLDPAGRVFQAAEVILRLRFERPPTDDEIVDIRVVFVDEAGTAREVGPIDPALSAGEWRGVRVALDAFAAFPRSPGADGAPRLLVRGWGLTGLPPRAEIYADAPLVHDAALPETDLILRGGNGDIQSAGRIFVEGRRSFIEHDWRYSLQPDLPNPPALDRPADLADRHFLYIDVWDRPVHAFEDDFLEEPAMAGEPTTFRSCKVTQVRAMPLPAGAPPLPPAPMGNGRLTTNVPAGARPDRFPVEEPDPCRDRCLFSENLSTGEGYRGKINAHVRIEVLHDGAGLAAPVIAWSRDNAATVAPLVEDAAATATSVVVAPEAAALFRADDIVVVEDRWTRLDPGRDGHRPLPRRLRAVDTASGRLEFFPAAEILTDDPAPLNVGGPLGRPFRLDRQAAVRLWDGIDWRIENARYNLRDGIAFTVDGDDLRAGEYWSFTARIADPDGGAFGIIEQLSDAPVHGPERVRAPVGLVEWLPEGRRLVDLRRRFLPLESVRDRLIELGRRRLSPGAFTVVVGDGVRTFGDVDQNIAEGVTGDEAIQTALARLGAGGGTIYVRAGDYILEHPVILQARSNVRILGDGDATRLSVTGAGGAFHLDACGIAGRVGLELMWIEETPQSETPFGAAQPADIILGPVPDRPGGPLPVDGIIAGVIAAPVLRPADLALAVSGPQSLVGRLGERLRDLRPGFGRIGASIVQTLARLRRLQRENPGQPLEDTAPDELAVLQGLPHGVVTVCDCRNVDVSRLTIRSRAATGGAGSVAAGVLATGDCANVRVRGNDIAAPAGVVALPYARYLSALSIVTFPRSTLFLQDLAIEANRIRPLRTGTEGISIADGRIDGLSVTDNRVEDFPIGIGIADRAESRSVALDRIVVRDNQCVDVGEIGIVVDGDGVDVEANEVRLADLGEGAAASLLRAGIRVTGAGVRVRDCWVALPPSAAGRDPFALEAGILVGGGLTGGDLLARPVSDLEVIDTRIEGSGAETLADGIVIGGPQPVHDIRLSRNLIQNLGGSGIRAMGHAGLIGSVQVLDNRIEDVARATLSWGAGPIRALGRLEPRLSALSANSTPRSTFERLLQLDSPAHAAIDAMLRWLDTALLRGAVVLALVEGALVARNTIRGVGTRTLEPGSRDPGAEMRTAGILAMGGRDLDALDNHVRDVIGVVQPIVFNPPGFLPPVRPPVLDLLDRMRLEPLAPANTAVFVPAAELHGSISGLRNRVADFAIADAAVVAENRAGLRLAVDAILPSMRAAGGELAVIADRMAEASEIIAGAPGEAEMRQGADALRAAASDAAGITAPDVESAGIWSLAGAFDRAGLTTPDVVGEQASLLQKRLDTLPKEQLAAVPELPDLVRRVLDQPGDATARRALAAETGKLALTVATAQTWSAPVRDGAAADAGATRDAMLAGERLAATRELSARIATTLARDANVAPAVRLRDAREPLANLIDMVAEVDADRARNLARAVDDLAAGRTGGVALSENRLTALRRQVTADAEAAIAILRERADAADSTTADRSALAGEVGRVSGLQKTTLLALTARSVDSRLAEAAAFDPLDEAFELRLAEASSRNLMALARDDDTLGSAAEAAFGLISKAAATDDAVERARLREEARVALDEIARAAPVPGAETVSGPSLPADRLGGLTQLALEIGGYDDAALRRDGATLFGETAERVMKTVGLPETGQQDVRRLVGEARTTLAEANPAPDARASAVAALASVADTLTQAARKSSAAAPETEPLALLSDLVSRALSTTGTDAEKVDAVKTALARNTVPISPALRDSLLAAPDLRGVLSGLGRGVGSLTGLVPLPGLRPPVLNGFRAHPADGIYCAALGHRLSLTGNSIAAARVGIVLAGASDHPLAPAGTRLVSAMVSGNTVEGAPVSAIDLRPDEDLSLLVADNDVRACSGSADPDRTTYGQAVLTIVGRGELNVNGNRLAGNGNTAAVSLLHEMLIDWRGDVTLRGNRVRHSGGALGGTGILVLTGDLDAGLVGRLSREPALVVEPAPQPPTATPAKPDYSFIPGLLDPQIFALSFLAADQGPEPAQSFEFGSFALADAPKSLSIATFAAGSRPTASIDPAVAAADAWIADTAAAQPRRPLLQFITYIPPLVYLPPPRARRSVQVVGNDIVADGPALQVLGDGGALVSAGVSANDLETSARTAAVYLRNLDAVVFTGNRCEALDEVNVAVLRCGNAAVTASANGLVGDQPAALPPKPLPPRKPPFKVNPGLVAPGLSLKLDLGYGAGLSLPIKPEVLLESLREAKGGGVFKDAAGQAESAFKVFAAEKALDPSIRIVGARNLLAARDGMISNNADAATAASDEQQQLQLLLQDPKLTESGKLYGVAKFLRFSDTQARTLVAQQLEEAGGDSAAALDRGITILAGSGEAGPATITERAAPRAVLEELIGYTIADRRPSTIFDAGKFTAIPLLPPPPPRNFARDRSLVIIGGARVAAVGNATTSGVYVHPGPDRVLLNV